MNFIQTYGKEIVALLVPILTWVLNVGLKPKVKLLWTSPHAFMHLIPATSVPGNQNTKDGTLHVASLVVFNAGRETATNVQITFNEKPPFFNLWPVRTYEAHTNPDGRFTLTFTSFAPKEELRVEMVNLNAQVPGIMLIRCDQRVAENVRMTQTKARPNWENKLIIFLIFAGIGSVVYWTIALVQLLVLRTPI